MKARLILPAAVIAGALLLGATGCSADAGKDTDSPSSSTSSSAASVAPITNILHKDRDAARNAAQVYFNVITNPEVLEKLEKDGAKFNGRETAPTDEELTQLAKDNPEAYKQVDTTNPLHIANAYIQLTGSAAQGLTYEITPESVSISTIEGKKVATVDPALVKIYQNGEWMNPPVKDIAAPPTAEEDKAHLIQQDDGRWTFVPLG